jgi:hypothetical protein
MVGAAAERSISLPPATEEVVPRAAQQEAGAIDLWASVDEGQGLPPTVGVAVEQLEETPV